jgi:hypothetical protein
VTYPILRLFQSYFVQVTDPVGAGLVESLARPGGNTTGFTLFELSTSGKWVELLKQIAPAVTRAVVLRDPTTITGPGQFAAVQSAASLLGLELRPVDIRQADQPEDSKGPRPLLAADPLSACHRGDRMNEGASQSWLEVMERNIRNYGFGTDAKQD